MSYRPRPHPPAQYEFKVGCHLDERWAAWFGADALTHDDDGTTTLWVDVDDQAQLHGLLAKVRDLGVTLISVTSDTPYRREPSSAAPPFEITSHSTPG